MKRIILTAIVFCAMVLPVFGQASKWENVAQLKGSGIVQTVLIPMVGERWRIKYESKTRASLRIVMLDENGKVVSNVCRHSAQQTMWNETGRMRKGLKMAALRIEGDINGWTLAFDQYVDEIADWELYKWRQASAKPLDDSMEKFGMWCGGSEDMTTKVNITSVPCRIVVETFEPGRIIYEISGSDKQQAVADRRLQPGVSFSWIYVPGEYTIKCSSICASWTLALEKAGKGGLSFGK